MHVCVCVCVCVCGVYIKAKETDCKTNMQKINNEE